MKTYPDFTPIMRLAREYGGFRATAHEHDKASVDRRFSDMERKVFTVTEGRANDVTHDLETAILWARAECLDDVAVQAYVAAIICDLLDASELEGNEHHVSALYNALRSMTAVLIRDHGDAFRERIASDVRAMDFVQRPQETLAEAKGLGETLEFLANAHQRKPGGPVSCQERAAS
jgi:hypothetical protein